MLHHLSGEQTNHKNKSGIDFCLVSLSSLSALVSVITNIILLYIYVLLYELSDVPRLPTAERLTAEFCFDFYFTL